MYGWMLDIWARASSPRSKIYPPLFAPINYSLCHSTQEHLGHIIILFTKWLMLHFRSENKIIMVINKSIVHYVFYWCMHAKKTIGVSTVASELSTTCNMLRVY